MVVVGGGLTGCACAWSFASAGVKVVLLEADRIAGGGTAASTGLIREDFDASFQETSSAHGLRAARTLWQGVRRASLDFAAAIKRLNIKCDLVPQDLLQVKFAATRTPFRACGAIDDARRAAGFDHTWMTSAALAREAAVDGGAAIRTRGFAFDPFRAGIGLADSAIERGATLFERSPVRRIQAGRKLVEVTTGAGKVRAQAVVIATAAALPDWRALRRHLHPQQSYVVVTEALPAAVRRELGRVLRHCAMARARRTFCAG